MNFKENFPVLSGEPQGRVKLESKDLKNKDSLIEKLKKGGRKYAAPIIATLISMGAIKESKSQDTKRVVSLDQITSAKVGDTVSVQENDSTVHMFKKTKQRADGTFKIKDLGTIKTTKGDAVKIGDVGKINIPEKPGFENKQEKNEDIISVGGKQYKPYRTEVGGETPKNKATGQIVTLPDGTPKYVWVSGKGWYVVSSEKSSEKNTINRKENKNEAGSIMRNGKKYLLHQYGESPFDANGKIKSNFITEGGQYYKLAE